MTLAAPPHGTDVSDQATRKQPVFFALSPPSSRDLSRAWAVAILLLLAFACTAPWAGRRLATLTAFVPTYDAAVAVLDFITAMLMLGQFRHLKERAFLALACGYIFTPILILAHGLAFPDAFVPGTLIGNAQTSAWLWMGWHGVFPFFVCAYGLLARQERATHRSAPPLRPNAAKAAIAATVTLALSVVMVCVHADAWLPALMLGSDYRSRATHLTLLTGWLGHLLALALLAWGTRFRRAIDVWLAVSVAAMLIDLALSALLVDGRYQLGWYLGRAYGLLAAVFVLAVLLHDTLRLYGRTVNVARTLEASEARLRTIADELASEVAERSNDLRQLLAKLESLQDDERRRIARDLHDSLGQYLTSMSLRIKAMTTEAGKHQAAGEAMRRLGTLEDLVTAADRELDRIVFLLRPPALEHCDLPRAIEELVANWTAISDLRVDLSLQGMPRQRLPMETETTAYRLVQEALNNISKHAHATRVRVTLAQSGPWLAACIEDDGVGFCTEEHKPSTEGRRGWGLLGLQERVLSIGGCLRVQSAAGQGTILAAWLPLPT